MMLLAIDTAGADCACGLYDMDGSRLVAEMSEMIGKGHAERLPGMIQSLLSDARVELSEVGRIGVTVGPGSFTGIRVGVALARGLALALSCPSIGISTLSVLAEDARPSAGGRPVLAALDGRRGDVYVQLFGAGPTDRSEAMVLTPEAACRLAEDRSALVIGSGRGPMFGDSVAPDRFPIGTIAQLAAAAAADLAPARPLYLRGADAKPQAGFAVARA